MTLQPGVHGQNVLADMAVFSRGLIGDGPDVPERIVYRAAVLAIAGQIDWQLPPACEIAAGQGGRLGGPRGFTA